MKRILAVLAVLVLVLGAVAFLSHKSVEAIVPANAVSFSGGTYNSQSYAQWGMAVAAGNTATGAQTITLCPEWVTLPDGRLFRPLAPANGVFSPFTIDAQNGTVTETVTPTAYVSITAPAAYPNNMGTCASVTATFSNAHGQSLNTLQVVSGDAGIQEAINDASLNNGGLVWWRIDPGIVTLSTSGANTNLGSVNIPTRSTVMVATAKVTTTIGTCAGGWSLGQSTGTEFSAANTTLTAGTTTDSSTLATPFIDNLAAGVPIAHCTTSNASAGAIHAHFEGYKLVAPGQ